MPWESLGSVFTGEMPDDEHWILFALSLARAYVLEVCGAPAGDDKLDIMWHDHDLGSYPSLGIWSDWNCDGDYLLKAEAALICFDRAVDWESLKEHYETSFNTEDEEDEDLIEHDNEV